MENGGCESEEIPCEFSKVNRTRLDQGKEQFATIQKNIDEHKKLTHDEALETRERVGCLEGKMIGYQSIQQTLLLEVIRKTHGERYADTLQKSINPNMDDIKLDKLRNEEKLLKQSERNLLQRIKNRLLELILIGLGVIAFFSYFYFLS